MCQMYWPAMSMIILEFVKCKIINVHKNYCTGIYNYVYMNNRIYSTQYYSR